MTLLSCLDRFSALRSEVFPLGLRCISALGRGLGRAKGLIKFSGEKSFVFVSVFVIRFLGCSRCCFVVLFLSA